MLEQAGGDVSLVRFAIGEALGRLPCVDVTLGETQVSKDLGRLLDVCDKLAQKGKDQYVFSELFLLAAIEDRGAIAWILKSSGVAKTNLEKAVDQMRGGANGDDPNTEHTSSDRGMGKESLGIGEVK